MLLAPKAPSDELIALLNQNWAHRANIKYLWGDPSSPADLKRARIEDVELVYVLADVNASPELEDLCNSVRAAAIYRLHKTAMLVMLLEANHIRFAVQAGIPERMCAGLDSLEIGYLAFSCHCVGLSSILLNLALPDLGSAAKKDIPADESWMSEYLSGANKELYGLQLPNRFNKMTFSKAALAVYQTWGVMLIAAQNEEDGRILLNPGSNYVLHDWSVLFCVASDEDTLDLVRREKGRHWLVAFYHNIAEANSRKQKQFMHDAHLMLRPGVAATQSCQRKAVIDEDVKRWFSQNDADGSGVLDVSELREVFYHMDIRLTYEQVHILCLVCV